MQISDEFPAASKSTYLNSASVALMPRSAANYLEEWQRDIADNGTLNFDEIAEEAVFDGLRASFAGLLGSAATDIAVASSASEMIASIAWAVMPRAGTKIVTTDIIFSTTAYPWARVARHTGAEMHFVRAEDGVIDEEALISAIDQRTSVVSICHVEYSTGQRRLPAGRCLSIGRRGADRCSRHRYRCAGHDFLQMAVRTVRRWFALSGAPLADRSRSGHYRLALQCRYL